MRAYEFSGDVSEFNELRRQFKDLQEAYERLATRLPRGISVGLRSSGTACSSSVDTSGEGIADW